MNPLLAAFGVTVACTVAGRMAGRYFGHDTLGTIGGLAVGLYAGNAVGNALAPKADAIAPNAVKERQVERAAEKPAEKPAEFTPAVPFIGWSNNAAAQNAAKVARSSGRMAQRRESSARQRQSALANAFYGFAAPLAGTSDTYAREVETPEQSRSRQTTINVRTRR